MTVHFPFQNSYAALPDGFFARVAPTPVAAPRLIKLNRPLAIRLGLDPDLLETPEGVEILAGKRVPDGAEPIAQMFFWPTQTPACSLQRSPSTPNRALQRMTAPSRDLTKGTTSRNRASH